ncbi:integrin alpha [Streptomyces sp. CAU 1734]|uniref:integrin alpha n=1 Tax=Streptomyces sp. CAU 1734 TaxID=3140360 RepID=UPI003261B4F4
MRTARAHRGLGVAAALAVIGSLAVPVASAVPAAGRDTLAGPSTLTDRDTAAARETPAGRASPGKGDVRDDFNRDGYEDLAVSAAGSDVPGNRGSGSVAVVYGSAAGLGAAKRKQLIHQGVPGIVGAPERGDGFGGRLASADLDRDGYTDLLVATLDEATTAGAQTGSVTAVWGGPRGLAGSAVLLTGSRAYARAGSYLVTGDFDGDGDHDVAAAEGDDAPVVRVLSGPFERDGRAAGKASLTEPAGHGLLDLASGDVNGDGRTDLVAQRYRQTGWADRHTVVWRGTPGGPAASEPVRYADGRILPGGDFLDVGDVNGDGYGDVVTGRTTEDQPTAGPVLPVAGGMIAFVPGSPSGPVAERAVFLNQDSPGVPGTPGLGGVGPITDQFGRGVAIGDLNGDGYGDIAAGVPAKFVNGFRFAGAVVVLYGTRNGPTGRGAKWFDQNSPKVPGTAEKGDWFGWANRMIDGDRDGRDELAVSAIGEDFRRGAVWIFASTSSGVTATGSRALGAKTLGTGGIETRPGEYFTR